MSESSTKRPPHTPAQPPRAAPAAAAAATEAVSAALPAPLPQSAPGLTGNPAAMPDPVALFDAFAHGAEAYADEMAGLAQAGFAIATDTAKAMLGAKTLTEAFEVNAGLFRKSLDMMVEGSIRLADITARLAEESLRPLMR